METRYDEARAGIAASTTDAAAQEAQLAELEGQYAGEQLRYSIGGRVGRLIEPAIEPLGFDWRIGVGIIGAFAAREVFVSTLGIVFGIAEADEESVSLRESLQRAERADGSPLMTPLAGVSLMVFFRPRLPVHEHHRRRAPRVGKLGLAGLHVRLHVDPGLLRIAGGLPGGLGPGLGRLIAPSRAAGRVGGGEGPLHSTGAAHGFATARAAGRRSLRSTGGHTVRTARAAG